MEDNLSVSWDEYQKNICKGFGVLQQRGEFVDMTLAADGHHVKVHQMVLSLVSPFIKDLIVSAGCPHPVIFLNRVSYETLQAILEYVYTGEVVVSKDKMGEFLEACKDLHIKGLDSMLQEARNTSNMLNEIAPRTDRTGSDDEDICIQPNKRKKAKQEDIIFEEVVQYDEDDYQIDDDMEGVESKDKTAKAHNKEQTAGSDNLSENSSKKAIAAIQYSVSCQGNLQVVVNRYLYALRHTRKNEQRFWRCISQQKTGCPAIVTTLQDAIVERLFPHNHPFHDQQIIKRVKSGNMFTSLNEVEDAAAAKRRKKDESDLLKQAFVKNE